MGSFVCGNKQELCVKRLSLTKVHEFDRLSMMALAILSKIAQRGNTASQTLAVIGLRGWETAFGWAMGIEKSAIAKSHTLKLLEPLLKEENKVTLSVEDLQIPMSKKQRGWLLFAYISYCIPTHKYSTTSPY